MKRYRYSTRAGRAWVEKILACATRLDAVEIDLLRDTQTQKTLWRDDKHPGLPARMRELLVDRYTIVYEAGDTDFRIIYTSALSAIRYEIATYAFDPSDLSDIPDDHD